MDSLSKLSEVVGSEEIVTLDSFLFLITGSPLMTWGRGFLCKVVESCPMCKQGSGFSLVGFPLIKCIEHTLSLYVGFHNFPVFGSFLLMFLIRLCLLYWSFFSVGNGKSMKGGLQTQMLVPKLQLCNLQKSAFQFLKWYVLFEHPTTAQIHVGIFNNLK